MPSRLVGFAQAQAQQAWISYANRAIQARQQTTQQLESAGFYEGYNAEAEAHQIRMLSGRVVDATSITTAGISAGERVVVSRAEKWRFKAMPR